jgi:hypothetical protein
MVWQARSLQAYEALNVAKSIAMGRRLTIVRLMAFAWSLI